MRKTLAIAALLLLPTFAAFAEDATKIDDDKMNAIIGKWIDAHPDLVVKSVNKYLAEQKAGADNKRAEAMLSADADLMRTDNLPILGDAAAPITMVYFVDAACHFCRHESTAISDIIKKNPDVRVIQRWVRFLTPASEYAARVAGIVYARHQNKYGAFYEVLMASNAPLTRDVVDTALSLALGDDAVKAVREEALDDSNKTWAQSVEDNMQMSLRLGVNGTPFHYVHGIGPEGLINGEVAPAKLIAAIEKARAGLPPKADAPKP